MSTAVFTRPSTKGVPQPFKPQEYADCAAVVLEPKAKQIARFNGRDRLEVVANLYIFDDPQDVTDGEPSETLELVVTWGRIASLLNRAMVDGRMVAACIGQDELTQYNTRPWTLRDLPAETEGKLATWLSKR